MGNGGNGALRFGDYELDSHSSRLIRDGRPVKIQPQPLRVLGVLVERPGEIVSREELQARIWGDVTFVEFDQGLNYCIRQIRLALGDEASEPVYVETLPKKGYRFIAPVTGRRPSNGVNGSASVSAIVSAKDSPDRQSPGPAGTNHGLSSTEASAPVRSAPRWRPLQQLGYLLPAVLLAMVILGGGVWLYQRSERQGWVRETAIPEIAKLTGESKPLAAYLLIRKAEQDLPGDPQLTKMEQVATRPVSIDSSPAGVKVEIQDYLSPDGGWFSLGTTPLNRVRIPDGYFRWKLSKPGFAESVTAPITQEAMQFQMESPAAARDGVVRVPSGTLVVVVDFIGWMIDQLPAFDIDRFEVTNRQYQEFVDRGGYSKREYWNEKFAKDGKELTWEQAMVVFRDSTDRPGPATWEGGHFLPGQAEYPVSGVSWYEAVAYAAFAGKSLPAMAQWYKAAPPDLARYSINQGNFGEHGLTAVGASHGVGPYGTYDMVGNVREWSLNSVDGNQRFILGGAWRTQTYQAIDPEALPPFDRSPLNGFRCVRNSQTLLPAVTAPLVRSVRDFSKAKPASDEVFQAYKTMYAYDHRPLNAETEGVVENTADWTKEKIIIDAGHGNERLPMYLFLPKNVHPPFQTVVFFPSARVEFMPTSQTLGDLQFVDYVIKSGRALLYPIYQGTYERQQQRILPGSIDNRELVIAQSKEVRRSIDYLETRPEIDSTRLAYLGVSAGTAYGVIYTALEDRLKTIVFLDGGFFLGAVLPGLDQVDFAPRIKRPVLMVNGRYDFTFSPDRSQNPLFRMLGTPPADKKHVVFNTPHDISQEKSKLSVEVLAWLDKYLGRIN
jgi:DNA-binding winged helix-turn-helix (wHTH) protein